MPKKSPMKPKVKVSECTLLIVQWRYCGKWKAIEVYSSMAEARVQLRERLLASPGDKMKRFRVVKNYHREETRTINKTTVIW